MKPDPKALEERAARLRSFLERNPGDDTAWFGLGRALADLERPAEAAEAFRRAVELRPDYTAAWRDLGRALLAAGQAVAASDALRQGLAAAERTGDLQAGREIEVFLRRATRSS
jgi:cytochrome c-type biogenesis protein CcmH/NrfG